MHLKEKLRYTTSHIFEKGKAFNSKWASPFVILIYAFGHNYQIKSLAEDKDGKDGRINSDIRDMKSIYVTHDKLEYQYKNAHSFSISL